MCPKSRSSNARTSEVPAVEVMVLNFNGREHLDRCFHSLSEQTYPRYTVTLIDNGSQDGSVEHVAKHVDWVHIMPMTTNLGYGKAYNYAVNASSAPLVALLNNDAYVSRSWLSELVKAMRAHPDVAACTSRIRLSESPGKLHHAGGMLTYVGTGWDIGYGQDDNDTFRAPRYVGSFSGAAVLVRRDVFLECGGFDPTFFAYCEDADLSWRCWLLGHRVYYVPTAIAYHRYGATGGGRSSNFRIHHAQRNRLASMIKCVGGTRLVQAICVSFGFDAFRCALYAWRRQISLIMATVAGSVAAARDIRRTLRARRQIQSRRVVSDRQLEAWGVLAPISEAIREYLRLEGLSSPKPGEGTDQR